MNSAITTVALCYVLFFFPDAPTNDSTSLMAKGSPPDSTVLITSLDARTKQFIQEVLRPEQNFWKRNEGTLLGAFLAVLTASLSVFVTHHFSNRREKTKVLIDRRKSDDLYSELVFAVYSILQNHERMVPLLKAELQGILDATKKEKELPIGRPYTSIPLELFDQILLRTLTYQAVNTKLLTLMTSYSLFAAHLNSNLNLTPVMNLKSKYKNEEDYVNGVKVYFEELDKLVVKLDGTLSTLNGSLIQELKRFPQNNLIDDSEQTGANGA